MSGTGTTGSGFAAHVHEVIDLDDQGASLGAVEGLIELMSVGVEEQTALRVLATSLHTGANVNQVVTGLVGTAARVTDGETDTRQSTERWINEGGSTRFRARPSGRARPPATRNEAVATHGSAAKWSWHEDRTEVMP
jgi:hypothetical protein